jgi:hypothetical protein
LRLSLTDTEGVLATSAGEEVRTQEGATVSLDLLDPKPVPFLRQVRGELTATTKRVVFLAASGLPRSGPFTFFNISLALHASAIEHFFTVQGGREFVQFEKGEVETWKPSGPAVEVVLRGPAPGKPAEAARYRMRIEPRSAGERALAALP